MKTVDLKPLEKSYLKVFRISSAIFITLISVPLTVVSSVFWDLPWPLIIVTFLVVWTLFFGLMYWYSIHWYKAYFYGLSETGLSIHKGVFWKQQSKIPRNRVQHIDITTGPIERRYDLSKLVVHTAGTRNASVTLPGLLQDVASQLRQELINNNQSEDTV